MMINLTVTYKSINSLNIPEIIFFRFFFEFPPPLTIVVFDFATAVVVNGRRCRLPGIVLFGAERSIEFSLLL